MENKKLKDYTLKEVIKICTDNTGCYTCPFYTVIDKQIHYCMFRNVPETWGMFNDEE